MLAPCSCQKPRMATCHVKDVKVRLIHECSRLLGVDAALCVTAWPDLTEPAISNSHPLSSESLNKIPLSAHARRAALDGSRNDGAISAELWCGVEERQTFGTGLRKRMPSVRHFRLQGFVCRSRGLRISV